MPDCQSVVTSLRQLCSSDDAKKEAAEKAAENITAAINTGKNVRVVAKDGEDTTATAFSKDAVSTTTDKNHNLIQIVRHASGLDSLEAAGAKNKPVKAVLLVTESRTTRKQATLEGFTAITTSKVRRILPMLTRRRAPSKQIQARHSPIDSEVEFL